ncbi:MAG: hypothetical protein GYA23_03915 [Methanomicrobiales archaeon]|nr:hypothetical protein [Methanomicrobiales archaeon]
MKIIDIISDRIIAITSTRSVIAAIAGFLILAYLINSRPFGAAELMAITGGVGLLDMEFLYSPDQAYAHLAAMGEAGRAFDLTHIIPLDMLLPFFYAMAFSLLITWLLHGWLPAKSPWHRLNVVPLVGGLCDYLENIGILTMLLAWPAELPDIARFTMAAGFFKFTLSAVSFLIIFSALAGWIVSALRKRMGAKPA